MIQVLKRFIGRADKEPIKVAIPSPIDILVVDDELFMLELLQEILSDYRVATATSGEQAWGIITKHQGAVRLVISDFSMGGMSGVQLFRMIKGAFPSIKRILCSGSFIEEDLFLYNENYHEAIAKPFTVGGVQNLVKYILSNDYAPKTYYTKELREVVSRLTEPPPPELQQAFLKIASMMRNV